MDATFKMALNQFADSEDSDNSSSYKIPEEFLKNGSSNIDVKIFKLKQDSSQVDWRPSGKIGQIFD
jgi:hypothetical protein